MNIAPSHLVFLVGTLAYLVIRGFYLRKASAQTKSVSKSTAGDRLLILLVGLAQVGLPLLLVFTPWLNRANYTLPAASIWLGIPTMLGALWLFWRAHADLGDSWSVTLELNNTHHLVTRGVYSVIRHPMYASFFALGISQALLLNNAVAGWAALLAVGLLYRVRVPHEERMMVEAFGSEYLAYMQRTGGIVPRQITTTNS